MRPSHSDYLPVRPLDSRRVSAIARLDGRPVVLEAFSYEGLSSAKRRRLSQALHHLLELKHENLVTYYTVVNDRPRQQYLLVSEHIGRSFLTETARRSDKRIFNTNSDIENGLAELLSAIRYIFGRHMHIEALRLIGASLFPHNLYLTECGQIKLAVRPNISNTMLQEELARSPELRPADLRYDRLSEQSTVFQLGYILFQMLLTADDFTEFTSQKAYLLSLHCQRRFGATLSGLVERMLRTVAADRPLLTDLQETYGSQERLTQIEICRGICRTKSGKTQLMRSAGANAWRQLTLYTPFQKLCLDASGNTALMYAMYGGNYACIYALLPEAGFVYRVPGVDYGDTEYVPTQEELDEIAAAEREEEESAAAAAAALAAKKTKKTKKKEPPPEEAPEPPPRPRSVLLREELEAKKTQRPLPYNGVRGTYISQELIRMHQRAVLRLVMPFERHLLLLDGYTDLMLAILTGDIDLFKLYKYQAGHQNILGWTACMFAVDMGHLPIVKALIASEQGLRTTNDETAGAIARRRGFGDIIDAITHYESVLDVDGNTLLHTAAIANDFDVISKYFHLTGQYNAHGLTALMEAARRGNDKVVELLAGKEGGLTAKEEIDDLSGWTNVTALMLAAAMDHPRCVALLEPHEAELREGAEQRTAFMAASLKNNPSALEPLSAREAGLQDTHGYTALMYAVLAEANDSIEKLIPFESKLVDGAGNTALMLAAIKNKPHQAQLLLKTEATCCRPDGAFALQLAIENNSKDATRVIQTEEGTLLTDTGFTSLMGAAFFGDSNAVSRLRSEVGKRTSTGMTALMYAAHAGHLDIVRQLAGEEQGLFDQDGWTAGCYALWAGHEEISNLLADKEYVATREKVSLLHMAAESGDIKKVQQYAHMVGRITKAGKTALQLAKAKKHTEIAEFLEEQQDVVDATQNTRLHQAILGDLSDEVPKFLHMAGAFNKAGLTALMLATEKEGGELVHALAPLECHMRATKGFTTGGVTFSRPTALMLAGKAGNVSAVEALIPQEAGLTTGPNGCTALMVAALYDKSECIELLRECDAEVGRTERTGKTALMLAAKAGKTSAVRALAEKESGRVDADGKNAATLAKQAKKTECVTALKPYEKPEKLESRPATRGDEVPPPPEDGEPKEEPEPEAE
ncbi:Ankyrin repeat protein 1 [Giardia muris]|uniref:Ankyrin repeat protein 1 n=1 Tax=Giardia muris TaxID=5742 RepID=A0A4Z1TAT3_GIAMU|nr:Ankyrin repeat protein 1 [Giardia muris]|eukprot:TNJ29639.1 Ankyrin repeat protein 1 [Giardia muris]